jgi:hypothetical protein
MKSVVNAEALKFLTPVREFTVHNATDEPVVLMYDGETRVIPPVDLVVYPHPNYEDVCFSAEDEDGDYIPGTLVLRDVYELKTIGDFMDGRMHWSAIKHCLEIDVRTGIASGAYAKKGLSILPPRPSKDLVARIKSEGQDRFLEWRITEARGITEAYASQALAWQKTGVAAPPPGNDYTKAVKILELTGGKETNRLEKVFAGKLAPKEDPETLEASETEAQDLSSLIAKKVQEALGRASEGSLETPDLVSAVQADPEAMKKIENIIRMRKAREAKKNASGV